MGILYQHPEQAVAVQGVCVCVCVCVMHQWCLGVENECLSLYPLC